jgi:competence CoiA-like predicted nuclease
LAYANKVYKGDNKFMQEQINLETITDIKELQSMAYPQIKLLNQAQNNVQVLEQRIAQLQSQSTDDSEETALSSHKKA